MKLSLNSLVRIGLILTLAANALAIAVARYVPPARYSRILADTRYAAINSFGTSVAAWSGGLTLLDRETGDTKKLTLGASEHLDQASCSPWRDINGRWQVVGRWRSTSGEGIGESLEDSGLARVSYPGGEVIDRIACERLPEGPPCWFPGTEAKIIYASSDGKLYRYTFVERGSSSAEESAVSGPAPLIWEARDANQEPLEPGLLSDVSWPADKRLQGRLLVAMRRRIVHRGRAALSPGQVWWLMLDRSGNKIIAAGRLTAPDFHRDDLDNAEESSPVIGANSAGELVLAYLTKYAGQKGWSLKVAGLDVDRHTLNPVVREGTTQTLSLQCYHTTPVFAIGGGWIAVIAGRDGDQPRLEQVSLMSKSTDEGLYDLPSTADSPGPAPLAAELAGGLR